MSDRTSVIPGTLDLLILKAACRGRNTAMAFFFGSSKPRASPPDRAGALYPALDRPRHQGLIESEWGTSHNNRRAKFNRLRRRMETV